MAKSAKQSKYAEVIRLFGELPVGKIMHISCPDVDSAMNTQQAIYNHFRMKATTRRVGKTLTAWKRP